MRHVRLRKPLAALLLAAALPLAHAQSTDAEARLRDLLRQTALELRDAQSQNAELRIRLDELQARQAARVPDKPPAAAADSGALRRAQAELAQLRETLAQHEQQIAQWQRAHGEHERLSREHENLVQHLDRERQALSARMQACERDNVELVGLGRELLQRYRERGVWAALRDAEPLTGIRRVRFEELAQHYHARLIDLGTRPAANATEAAASAR